MINDVIDILCVCVCVFDSSEMKETKNNVV